MNNFYQKYDADTMLELPLERLGSTVPKILCFRIIGGFIEQSRAGLQSKKLKNIQVVAPISDLIGGAVRATRKATIENLGGFKRGVVKTSLDAGDISNTGYLAGPVGAPTTR